MLKLFGLNFEFNSNSFKRFNYSQTPNTIKKYFLFCCTTLLAFAANAQNITIPNYNQQKLIFIWELPSHQVIHFRQVLTM